MFLVLPKKKKKSHLLAVIPSVFIGLEQPLCISGYDTVKYGTNLNKMGHRTQPKCTEKRCGSAQSFIRCKTNWVVTQKTQVKTRSKGLIIWEQLT